jgi:hypothetical protein
MIEKVQNKLIFDMMVDFTRTREGWIPALEVGVHESLHALDRQTSASAGPFYTYNTLDGKLLKWPSSDAATDFILTQSMLPEDRRDEFSFEYLPDRKQGGFNARNVNYIFRELNAYAVGFDTRTKLAEVVKNVAGTEHPNTGIEHLMFYMSFLLGRLKVENAELYKKYQAYEKEHGVFQTLWTQAEDVLERACKSKHVAVVKDWLQYSFESSALKNLTDAFPEFKINKPKSCELN